MDGKNGPEVVFKSEIVWWSAVLILGTNTLGLLTLIYIAAGQCYLSTFIFGLVIGFWGNQGITMGAHRYWTHKCFKAVLPLQICLMIGQTLAGQNSILTWARDHRTHHKFSDTDADPHNSNRGFFFSHMGWLMMKKHPDVKRKGKSVDMSDLSNFQALYFLVNATAVAIPYLFMGETFIASLLVCFFMRYTISLQLTWCVNSVAHFFGTKPYSRNIRPAESLFVSLFTAGEGWHNYHHTFPWDYKAGEFGGSTNVTCVLIELLSKIGATYDLRTVDDETVKDHAIKFGDGSYHSYERVPNDIKVKEL